MTFPALPDLFIKNDYHFKKAGTADLPLVRRWLSAGHLSEWWVPSENELAAVMAGEVGQVAYIVTYQGWPFAFLYMSDPAYDPDLADRIDFMTGTIRFDQFIGDTDMIGVGHGIKFIKAYVAAMREAPGVGALLVTPRKDNIFAARTYSQCGFRPLKTPGDLDISVTLMHMSLS